MLILGNFCPLGQLDGLKFYQLELSSVRQIKAWLTHNAKNSG